MKRDFAALKAFIAGQVFEVVQSLIGLGDGKDSTYHDQPCPLCIGEDRFYFNPEKGTYHCRGDCEFSGDIIDLIEAVKGVTKTEAFDIIAKHVGYVDGRSCIAKATLLKATLPRDETETVPPFQTSKLIEDATFKQVQQYRPEISFDGFKRAGAKHYCYGEKSGIAIPMYDNDGERCGWVRYGTDGSKKNSPGSKSGIVGKDSLDALLQKRPVNRVFKTAGVSDRLVLSKEIIENGFEDYYYAFTNGAGEGETPDKFDSILRPALEGISVVIIADNDKAGKAGAQKWATYFVDFAKTVRIIWLPKEVSGHSVKDLRDYIAILKENGEDVIKMLIMLVKEAEPVTPEVVESWKQAESAKKESKTSKKNDGIIVPCLIDLSKVEIKPIDWLWPQKIPYEKISLLAGLQKQGKSMITVHAASIISQGGNWYDGSPCEKGSVLFFAGEDDPEEYARRLQANGADRTKIRILDSAELIDESGESKEIIITLKSLNVIEAAISHTEIETGLPVRMLVIDPISNFWGGIKESDNAQVRSALHPLQQFFHKRKIAPILIQHLRKSGDANAMLRITGSGGITGIARNIWAVYEHPEDAALKYYEKRRCFVYVASNIPVDSTGLLFRTLLPDGRVDIVGTTTMVANDFEATQAGQRGRPAEKLAEAKGWLQVYLANGERPAAEIYQAAKAAEIKKRTLEEAKAELGITSQKHGSGEGSHSTWKLPSQPVLLVEEEDT